MENQEPQKAPETTADAPGKDRGAEVKSDLSSHQNVEVENQKPKKAPEPTVQFDRSPGQDRGL